MCYFRGHSNNTLPRVKITRLFLQCTQAQQSGSETPGESAQESSMLAVSPLPDQQCTTKPPPPPPPSHILKQLCQVSQSQSFAPNLTSLFGSTTNCVINVNFGQSSTSVKFQNKKDFHYEMPEEMDKALSIMDFNF